MPTFSHNNLVWIDMEMSGLNPEENVILEVAMVITDSELNILTTTPSYVIYQPEYELLKMDNWNVKTHTKTGLIEKVKASTTTINQVETEILKLVQHYCEKLKSPLCGNTIYQDRKFIAKYMPNLESFLHYRNIDVSSLKELCNRWYPEIAKQFKKANKHEALADVLESIEELKFYRTNIFKLVTTNK